MSARKESLDRPDVRSAIDARLADATEVVRAYAGSDVSAAIVSMLTALEASYVEDLKRVSVDDLQRTQTSLRQTVAIREVIENIGDELPRA